MLGNLARVNGALLRGAGYGVEDLHVSELCDVAYSMLTDDLERNYYAQVAAGMTFKDSDTPLADAVYRFEERIGLRENPESIAMELHKRWRAAQGLAWDDTPVGQGGGNWWEQDVEDFRDMSDLDKPTVKRPVRPVPRRVEPAKEFL